MTSSLVDINALSPHERSLWWDGWHHGRVGGLVDGHAEGYAACDNEIATLQREAARMVHRMAGLPERNPEADRKAAQRRADRFGQPLFGARQ